MNKKKLLIIMIILGIAFIILGSTFAYLSWRSSEEQKTNVVFTITGDFSCAADGGGNITSNDLILVPTEVTTSTSSNYVKREVKVKPTITKTGKTIYMDLWLDINGIDSGLTNSDNFMYAFTTSSTSPTDGVVASGNFKDKTVGDKIELLSSKNYSTTSTDTYYLWIWLDSAETSQTTMDQTFSLSLNGSCTDATPSITVDMLINKANPSTLMYADATDNQKGEMWTFNHDATAQTAATTDYRYIGNTPNNYINFNNETWRIIGVFDGRIKIIRDDRIENTNIRWDYKQNGVGSSTTDYGSNDWTDSQLMYMLNSTSYKLKTGYSLDGNYIKDTSGNIIYQLGCHPSQIAAGATSYSCTANTWRLNDTALSQIAETTYYLGGISSYSGKDATYYYNFERGTTTYNNTRPTSWSGLVGLMYPSDYGYTFANGVNEKCYINLYGCNSGTPSASWLHKSNFDQWTVSPGSGGANVAFDVRSSGYVGNRGVNDTIGMRPVAFLKSDIQLTGTGTSTKPYEIIG